MKVNLKAGKEFEHKELDDSSFGRNEMIAMCGGSDAYAESFANEDGLPLTTQCGDAFSGSAAAAAAAVAKKH